MSRCVKQPGYQSCHGVLSHFLGSSMLVPGTSNSISAGTWETINCWVHRVAYSQSFGVPPTLISYIVGSNSRTHKSCKHPRLLRAYCDFHFCVIFVFWEVYSIVDGWVLSSPSTCWRAFDMFNPILAPPWNPINGVERTRSLSKYHFKVQI